MINFDLKNFTKALRRDHFNFQPKKINFKKMVLRKTISQETCFLDEFH